MVEGRQVIHATHSYDELRTFRERPKVFVSWGDYQEWHLNVIAATMRELYGEASGAEIKGDAEGNLHLWYDGGAVDVEEVGRRMGVQHSGPSVSSSSSDLGPGLRGKGRNE